LSANANTLITKAIILEITVTLTLFSDGDVKFKMVHKALIDTGCTKSLIERNRLPDDFFESWKVTNKVSLTPNAGRFRTIFLYNSHFQGSLQIVKLPGSFL
jgi:hypothetical protein